MDAMLKLVNKIVDKKCYRKIIGINFINKGILSLNTFY